MYGQRDLAQQEVRAGASERRAPDENTCRALILSEFPAQADMPSRAETLVCLLAETGRMVETIAPKPSALTRHALDLTRNGRYRRGVREIAGRAEVAVIFGDALGFDRLTQPRWYQRRMEEIRRLRLVLVLLLSAQSVYLLLSQRRTLIRSQFSIWLLLTLGALILRRKFTTYRTVPSAQALAQQISGRHLPQPDPYQIDEAMRRAALKPGASLAPHMTPHALRESRQLWARGQSSQACRDAVGHEIAWLTEAATCFNLRNLNGLGLLPRGCNTIAPQKAAPTRASAVALEHMPGLSRFGLPITRYMLHLRAAQGLEQSFPLDRPHDMRRFLRWYMTDAADGLPGRWLPFTEEQRAFFIKTEQNAPIPPLTGTSTRITSTRGRDEAPFALSPLLLSHLATHPELWERFALDRPAGRIAYVMACLATLPADKDPFGLAETGAEWLAAPLANETGNATRFEILLGMLAQVPLNMHEHPVPLWQQRQWREITRGQCEHFLPALIPLLSAQKIAPRPQRTGVIAGLPTSHTGLGSNLRMSRAALNRIDLRLRLIDLDSEPEPSAPQGTITPKRNFALHHVNADRIPQTIMSPHLSGIENCYQIGFLLWEFQSLPQAHLLALDMLDEIWVPSRFLARLYRRNWDRPVIEMGKGFDLPPPPERARSGTGPFRFLVCFDQQSSVARKNPLAAVSAFQQAFGGRDDVRLTVKTTPLDHPHWGDPEGQMARIMRIAAADPRIHVETGTVAFEELLALIGAHDCLISPHRAEGFGLLPAYALGLGTAVIATDYSGTQSFCTPDTAFPVLATMVSPTPDEVIFPLAGAVWAEINRDALIATMRHVADHPELARQRAQTGQKLIRSQYSMDALSARYQERLRTIGVL